MSSGRFRAGLTRMDLTQYRLRELLHYDPDTGIFSWKLDLLNGIHRGDIAGWKSGNGYIKITYRHKNYFCHRLAFLYMLGEVPKFVDHINGIRADNRFSNLRAASRFINAQNQRAPKRDNKCGFLGVYKKKDRFKAKIKHLGKITYLGTFDTAQDAYAAYLNAKRLLHEGCTI